MGTRRKVNRKMRHSDITAYKTFTDNFILTPNITFLTDSRIQGLSKEHSRTYPILKVEKPTGTRWKFEAIPNIRSVPKNSMQMTSRALPIREETFDADFMMPSQIREVLEEEGLETNVINGVMGKVEENKSNPPQKSKTTLRCSIPRVKTDSPKSERIVLPPIITTQRPVPKPKHRDKGLSSSLLDLSRQQPRDRVKIDLWKNPLGHRGRDEYLSWNYGRGISNVVEEVQTELDRKNWVAAQHVEQINSGDDFTPPRVVLISSKVPKCHLLTKVYNTGVIPILYDFDTCTFTELLDAIAKKLNLYKKNCKARSIMVLGQGGPGYIYLLKNFAITPQKLYKPSYRSVVGFWRALAGMISKLNPEDAAIHIFGFNLTENEQGKKLLPMLQSLVYPNLVRIDVPTEDTATGREMIGYYFRYSRYQIWKSYQKSSFNGIDFVQEETGPVKRNYGAPILRLAR